MQPAEGRNRDHAGWRNGANRAGSGAKPRRESGSGGRGRKRGARPGGGSRRGGFLTASFAGYRQNYAAAEAAAAAAATRACC